MALALFCLTKYKAEIRATVNRKHLLSMPFVSRVCCPGCSVAGTARSKELMGHAGRPLEILVERVACLTQMGETYLRHRTKPDTLHITPPVALVRTAFRAILVRWWNTQGAGSKFQQAPGRGMARPFNPERLRRYAPPSTGDHL